MASETVQAQEYQQFMALRDQMKKGIQEADSEFMMITYTALLGVLNKRQHAANNLNIKLENKQIAEVKKTKRDALAQKRESA
jgi:ABC-type lipoprotein release transport system permease subunit